MNCYNCGNHGVIEASGRSNRIEYLKEVFSSGKCDREQLSERIMDEIDSEDFYMCSECLICPICFIEDITGLCIVCDAPACKNCSMEAAKLDDSGELVPIEGSVMCSRCSPPSHGTPEECLDPVKDPSLVVC